MPKGKKPSAWQEFKDFILRGNVVDLAVAVVIGAAFAAVVNALVKDIITPIIAAIFGKPDFGNLSFTIHRSHFLYGDFINAVITFLTWRPPCSSWWSSPSTTSGAPAPRHRGAGQHRAPVPPVPEHDPQGGQPLRLLHRPVTPLLRPVTRGRRSLRAAVEEPLDHLAGTAG